MVRAAGQGEFLQELRQRLARLHPALRAVAVSAALETFVQHLHVGDDEGEVVLHGCEVDIHGLRQTADIEREEVDRRGVQAVVLHPLPDGKAGAGGFAVFGLEGDVGIVMRRVVRELRVDLLLGDLRQIFLHDLGGHILDLDADVVLIAWLALMQPL